jgi:signal peptide peptidase SppA
MQAPLLLKPDAVPGLMQLLFNGPQAELLAGAAQMEAPERAYDVMAGVAIIPVRGMLVAQTDWLSDYFGWTGYDFVGACFAQAIEDPDVRAIALHIDSTGGMVSGCFDLADTLFAARGSKPVWAILDDVACSAAYALASAADKIVAPRTGVAGSIGVICIYPDISKMLEEFGVTMNMISFGEAKTDGYPYAPMSADARKRVQGMTDQLGEIFVSTVARHRGMTPKAVRDTEAQCFLADEAAEAGLIDAVMAPDAAFAALVASLD